MTDTITRAKRTEQQNKSIHLYLTWISEALNSAGFSVEEVLKNYTMELSWTPELAKEIIWRTAQKRMYGKKSTTELLKTSGEINQIHDVINRFLSERLKIEFIPFPTSCKTCSGIEKHEIGCPDENKYLLNKQ